MFGFGAALTGGGMLWAHSTQRGPDGYLTSPTYTLHDDGYGPTAEEIHLLLPGRRGGRPSVGGWCVSSPIATMAARTGDGGGWGGYVGDPAGHETVSPTSNTT